MGALRSYYARVEADLVARGLLRTEAAPPDAPFDARMLARNFEAIAFFSEYSEAGGRVEARRVAAPLRRWEEPVSIEIVFGRAVPDAQRRRDRAEIASLAQRIAGATGLPISLGGARPNLHIVVADADDRQDTAWLRAAVPNLSEATAREIARMPRGVYCMAYSFSSEPAPAVFTRAVVLIKDEQPPLLRRACFHEEIAQAMGLSNDSLTARPSIFNDDEEFALLTRHDEMLLGMLYDPALRPGMTADAARPMLPALAQAQMAGES
ncbi:MAG: DUF2927 domain-containing protein [Rhodobacteraceae bacterium]|nr:DUF2927 domain-containing protein [Paracoccaceae bacterium]